MSASPPKGWNLWGGVSQRVPTLPHSPLGRAMPSTDIFLLMDVEKKFSSQEKSTDTQLSPCSFLNCPVTPAGAYEDSHVSQGSWASGPGPRVYYCCRGNSSCSRETPPAVPPTPGRPPPGDLDPNPVAIQPPHRRPLSITWLSQTPAIRQVLDCSEDPPQEIHVKLGSSSHP